MSAVDGDDRAVIISDVRVTLRPWHRDDAPFIAAASADPATQRYNGVHDRQGRPAPALSVEDAEGAIDRFARSRSEFETTGNPTGVAFAIADASSGELVGCCGVDDWTGEDVAQFGYWVAAPARRQGYATRAAKLLTRWLFERGAARVFLMIVAENLGSAAGAQGAGIEYEGTMRGDGIWQGQLCDVMLFAALARVDALNQPRIDMRVRTDAGRSVRSGQQPTRRLPGSGVAGVYSAGALRGYLPERATWRSSHDLRLPLSLSTLAGEPYPLRFR